MSRFKQIFVSLFLITFCATLTLAQDKTTGSIRGKVRVETGKPSEVAVIIRQNDRDVTETETNAKGEFVVNGLQPGTYSVTFRKPGLMVGTIKNVAVQAGKVRTLGDRLVLAVDESSLAFLRGSVFDPGDRSVPGARVELYRFEADGSLKKLADRVTTETGQFAFRLPADKAKYRVVVKMDGAQDATKDVEVDDAVVYRIALTLEPVQK